MVARPTSTRNFAALRISAVVLVAAAASACFDSDETFRVAGTTTTGPVDPVTSTTTDEPSSSTAVDPTTGGADVSCRDGVGCIQQCALDLITDPGIEPDLGCFTECIEERGLNVTQAYHLLRLANCAASDCEEQNRCGSGGDSATGTGTGTGTTTSDGGGGDDGGLIDPCLICIFGLMTDPEPTVCVEFHELCDPDPV